MQERMDGNCKAEPEITNRERERERERKRKGGCVLDIYGPAPFFGLAFASFFV